METSYTGRTLSLQLVADPIAKQVAELEKLVHSKRGGTGFPDVVTVCRAIREAVGKLQQVVATEASKSQDKQLKVDMPLACDMTVKASNQLVDTATRLKQHPESRQAKTLFVGASKTIQSGLTQVLLHWDSAEVQKICDAAQVARDKLQIMGGSKSMRALLLSFKNYAESMKYMLAMVDKRQKELVNEEKKKRLLSSLDKMKQSLPKFSSAMQNHVRSHNPATKEVKNVICAELTRALEDLVSAVKDEGSRRSMATTIKTVKDKLGTSKRYSIGPELDRHINAIIENSKAVAHVSGDEHKEMILRECGEVLTLRKELGAHFEAVSADPGSARAKRAFDKCAKKLCEKLNELDRLVADSVVDQVTDVFVEASAPLNHLVRAATHHTPQRVVPTPPTSTPAPPPFSARHAASSSTSPEQEEADGGPSAGAEDTKRMAEVFRRHSRRLSQVAAYAAQSSTDAERIKLIKDLADAIDELTYVVVNRAEMVSKNPADKKAKEELNVLRRKWASKVQELTRVIDDIIDPEDFMAQSEANIQQDMEKCQAAMRSGMWEELRRLVLAIAAKARRALEVGEAAVAKASDRTYKATLSTAVTGLERAIPKIISTANRLIEEPGNRERRDHFMNSLQELLTCLHNIQSVLGTEIDVSSGEEGDEDGFSLSPSPSPEKRPSPARRSLSPRRQRETAEERMARRRVQSKPQYIGSLGAAKGRTSRHQQTFDEPDLGLQDDSLDGDGFNQSFDSGTQTTPTSSKNQSSQVDEHYLSTNATYGSVTRPQFSPESSTSTWKTPVTPTSSPIKHALFSPSPLSPPNYPAPSPPSHSPPLSPRRAAPPSPSPSPADLAVSSYVSPFQKLVSAARKGDQQEVQGHAANLSARVIRLTGMADSAASTLDKNSDLVKVIQTKSSVVSKLTPRILDQADLLSRNPQQQRQREEFQAVTHQWAGNVRDLINAMQQANLPWSRRAEQLVKAAENKDRLDMQMDHISSQTKKMLDVATMAIEAAMTEEAIGGGEPDVSVNEELQEEVRLVRTKMSEIEKLTPQLLGAAEMAAGQSSDSASSEHLHLLAQEWATKAKMLMKGVDDITLGMGGAADTLFLSAKSGDPGLQQQQSKAIKHLASSLGTIADEALEGCSEEEKVQVVHVVARKIEKLSTRLVECADIVAEAVEGEEELDQTVQENTEILRRDWSSQVHLLTAHIDDLTAEASAPLDRLVDIALQANRTSNLQTKRLLMKRFDAKANFLTQQLNSVERLFGSVAASLVQPEKSVRSAGAAIGFLKKLSPHAVAAAKSLESEPGSAMLEHFNHLRRQWAAKAQFLLGNLRKIASVNVDEVIDAFMDLLHDAQVTSPRSHVSDSPSVSSLSGSSLTPMQRSFSSEVLGDTTPVTRFDFDDSDFRAPSTPMIDSRPKKKQQIPTLAEMGLKPVPPRVRRPTSMAVPLPSWATVGDGGEDINSADSIARAAQSLHELTDEFSEESNPMVSVGKKMSEQMTQMAEFARGKGDLKDKTDMILTAKAVAANGQTIHRIANAISKQCEDMRSRNNLLCCAEMIPTLSTQLTILASVKTATPDDSSADVMLVKNAQNLMQAVIKTVQAAEAACMKEPNPVLSESMEEGEGQGAVELAMSWKRKLYVQRAKESISAPRGARGLRKLNKFRISTPSVVDVIKPSDENMKSPTKY